MLSPFEAELRSKWRREDLLREADAERLAHELAHSRQPSLRSRMATVLYALATRLDPSTAAQPSPSTMVPAR